MRRVPATFVIVSFVSVLLIPAAIPAAAARKIASLQTTIDTTTPWSPTSSPDPAGVAWSPAANRLIVVDSEVEETVSGITHYAGANTFEATPIGALVRTSTTYPDYSQEPTDVAANGSTVYVSDDDLDQVFVIDVGADGELNTPDDIRTSFSTRAFNSHDPEGLAYGNGALWVSDGVNTQLYRVDPGPNGLLDGTDDRTSCFDTSVLGIRDPEGITVDPASGDLYIVSRMDREIAEATPDGRLVDLITLADQLPFTTQAVNPAGVAVAPASDDPTRNDLYIADRAVDNNTDPNEVDGKVWEIRLSDPTTNLAPVVSAPGPQAVVEGEPIVRQISAHDPNDDAITYSATGLPPGLSVDPATGLITGTIAPGAAAGSPYASTLRASDGTWDGSRNANWTVSATGTFNTPPTLANPGDQSTMEGQPVDLQVSASDPDAGNVMMFSAQGLPPGLWMDCLSGTISGQVAAGTAAGNPYRVRVSVSDQVAPGLDGFPTKWDAQTFSWTVTTAGGSNPPPGAPAPPSGDQGQISFRSASSASVRLGTSITVATPSAVQQGDLMLAAINVSRAASITPPAGWTRVRSDRNGSRLEQLVFMKVAVPTEPASYRWGFSRRSPSTGVIVAYAGVASVDPVDASGGQANPRSRSIGAPSVTAPDPGGLLVGFFGIRANATIAPPVGMIEQSEAAAPGQRKLALEVSDGQLASAGATGIRSARASQPAISIGQVVVLRASP